ncbi:MAG: glutamate racemase [Anaerolineales bacterium]|jgi:glutamate racemase
MLRDPIGIFDSGVGGLSVLREIRAILPAEDLLYFADQAHVPYGPRALSEVRAFSQEIARFLIDQGSKIIVVACNTASAAALKHLRTTFPRTPFVGMEPAVKPAAAASPNRIIGVIATEATFQGELFASLVERFAQGVRVLTQTCPGLVEMIEAGDLDGPEVRSLLRRRLGPLQQEGIDALVLGCTHYPFVTKAIKAVLGPQIPIIDPAPAVARQVARVLARQDQAAPSGSLGSSSYLTSGDPGKLEAALRRLLGEVTRVGVAGWVEGCLKLL